jgi:glycosyltransferase involved in cell wall biosynthesis
LVVEEENLGGAELSFLELARALASRCDLHLALSRSTFDQYSRSSVYRSVADAPVAFHLCQTRLNPGTVTNLHSRLRRRPALELARLIAAVRPAVIIANLPTVERGQAIVDAADLVTPRPPVWGFLHLAHRPSTIGARLGRLRDPMVQGLLRRFDRLLTVSETGARLLSRRYGLGQPEVLHPPTAPLHPAGRGAERARRRIEQGLPDRFLLGMVGRVQLHHKGQDVALRVLARLVEAGCPLHLVVIGDGPDLPSLRRMADGLGIAQHISFLGWREDAGELIPLLDALILPSRFEGLPQTALQASTAGVPVIGYAVDGLAELLPADFQISYGDERGLARAVAELQQGTRRWPFQELARRAAEWGDPDGAAERLLELVRDMVGKKSGESVARQRA